MFMEIDVGILPDVGARVKKTFTGALKNFLTSLQLGSC
jgi:hypothetical protein